MRSGAQSSIRAQGLSSEAALTSRPGEELLGLRIVSARQRVRALVEARLVCLVRPRVLWQRLLQCVHARQRL